MPRGNPGGDNYTMQKLSYMEISQRYTLNRAEGSIRKVIIFIKGKGKQIIN